MGPGQGRRDLSGERRQARDAGDEGCTSGFTTMRWARKSPTRWKWAGGSIRKGRRRSTARSTCLSAGRPGGASDSAQHGDRAPGHDGAQGADDPAQFPAAHALSGQGADARGDLSRWPAGGHQPGQSLHQQLAYQLHLRPRLRAGLPQGHRPDRDVDSRQYGRQQEQSGSAAVGDLGRPDGRRDGASERAAHLHHGRGLPADRRGTPEAKPRHRTDRRGRRADRGQSIADDCSHRPYGDRSGVTGALACGQPIPTWRWRRRADTRGWCGS